MDASWSEPIRRTAASEDADRASASPNHSESRDSPKARLLSRMAAASEIAVFSAARRRNRGSSGMPKDRPLCRRMAAFENADRASARPKNRGSCGSPKDRRISRMTAASKDVGGVSVWPKIGRAETRRASGISVVSGPRPEKRGAYPFIRKIGTSGARGGNRRKEPRARAEKARRCAPPL